VGTLLRGLAVRLFGRQGGGADDGLLSVRTGGSEASKSWILDVISQESFAVEERLREGVLSS